MTTNGNLHKVFKSTLKREICVWLFFVFGLIIGIISSIYLINYWKKRNYPFIKKRHPSLVLISSICLILIISIERPLSGFVRLSHYTSIELQWIRWILQILLNTIGSLIFAFRLYIQLFDIKFVEQTAQNKWIKYIQKPAAKTLKNESFFVRHHNKFGNLYKIYIYIIIITIFCVLLTIILSIIDIKTGILSGVIINAITLFLSFLCWFITPTFLDQFQITVEFRLLLRTLFAAIIVYIIYFIVVITNNEKFKIWFLLQCGIMISLSSFQLIQTIWVLYKFKDIGKDDHDDYSNYDPSSQSSISPKRDSFHGIFDKKILELDIVDIIKEKIGFECFMNHLAKEFSMENLLGIIEMTQYKKRFREIKRIQIQPKIIPLTTSKSLNKNLKNIVAKVAKSLSVGNVVDDDDVDADDDETIPISPKLSDNVAVVSSSSDVVNRMKTHFDDDIIKLPDSIPFSTIIYGLNYDKNDETNNFENIMKIDRKKEAIRIINELFQKYIDIGSELELNLSSRLRKRYMEKKGYINDMEDVELEHMFDKCMVAVLKLMQDSYSRFKNTKEFITYEEKANKRVRDNSKIKKNDLGGFMADLFE